MPSFDSEFRSKLLELFVWRRDVRHFRTDPLPPGMLERLLALAALAPSVGLSQPWRFVIVEDPARRRAVLDSFRRCNRAAQLAYEGERAAEYAGLKLAGLVEAPAQFAAFADAQTEIGHGLGRRTMPEMIEYSVVSALMLIWLQARAEGIGMGWVSILDPVEIARILDVPASWKLVGYFCLGYPASEDEQPELERLRWEGRQAGIDHVLRR